VSEITVAAAKKHQHSRVPASLEAGIIHVRLRLMATTVLEALFSHAPA